MNFPGHELQPDWQSSPHSLLEPRHTYGPPRWWAQSGFSLMPARTGHPILAQSVVPHAAYSPYVHHEHEKGGMNR